MNKILLTIGGIINLLAAAMHVSMGLSPYWGETLSCLSADNLGIMYTLNIHVAFTCLIFACLSLFFRKDLLSTGAGRAVTAGIALFWILRLINQIIFYGIASPGITFWVIVCLIVALIYAFPTVGKRRTVFTPTVS